MQWKISRMKIFIRKRSNLKDNYGLNEAVCKIDVSIPVFLEQLHFRYLLFFCGKGGEKKIISKANIAKFVNAKCV